MEKHVSIGDFSNLSQSWRFIIPLPLVSASLIIPVSSSAMRAWPNLAMEWANSVVVMKPFLLRSNILFIFLFLLFFKMSSGYSIFFMKKWLFDCRKIIKIWKIGNRERCFFCHYGERVKKWKRDVMFRFTRSLNTFLILLCKNEQKWRRNVNGRRRRSANRTKKSKRNNEVWTEGVIRESV